MAKASRRHHYKRRERKILSGAPIAPPSTTPSSPSPMATPFRGRPQAGWVFAAQSLTPFAAQMAVEIAARAAMEHGSNMSRSTKGPGSGHEAPSARFRRPGLSQPYQM